MAVFGQYMTSITKQVWEILDNDITIKKDLERGIINVSALAQYILETYAIKGSLDSVISAIRRYKADETIQDDYAKIAQALNEAVISTKTNISGITLRNTSNVYKYVGQLMSHEDFLKNDVFRLIKTRHEVQIVVDRDSFAKAKAFFPESAVEETRKGIVELSIQLTPQGWDTKGVLSRIANELATQGINIVMIFSVYPSISIFLDEKDLVRAHEAIVRISARKE
jgi:aspartokinase